MPKQKKEFTCPRCRSFNHFRGICTSCTQEIAKDKGKGYTFKINTCICCLKDFMTPFSFANNVCDECYHYIETQIISFKLSQMPHLVFNWNTQKPQWVYPQIQGANGMLYIHYEKMTISDIQIARLAFSSSDINIHVAGANDFDLVKKMITFIKQIPSSDRTQEKHTTGAWVWTFPQAKFDVLTDMWIQAGWIKQNRLIEHKSGLLDLFIQHGQGYGQQRRVRDLFNDIDMSIDEASKEAPAAEDFFYNNAQPVGTGTMPIEQLKVKLIELLGTDIIDKSAYKKACRKYHPDFNGGDGSKMSELNYLYQQYNQMIGA